MSSEIIKLKLSQNYLEVNGKMLAQTDWWKHLSVFSGSTSMFCAFCSCVCTCDMRDYVNHRSSFIKALKTH